MPAELAELLVTCAARCGGAAQTVLSTLAVASRPLGEDLIGAVSGLDADHVRGGLAGVGPRRGCSPNAAPGGQQRPRHALLAEAVVLPLMPGEREDRVP